MATAANLKFRVDLDETVNKYTATQLKTQKNLQKVNKRKGYGRAGAAAATFLLNAASGGTYTPIQLALGMGVTSGLFQFLGAKSVKQDPMVESKLLNKQFKEAYQEGEDARETLIGAIPQSASSDAFSTYVLSGTKFFEDVTKQTSNFLDRANQVAPTPSQLFPNPMESYYKTRGTQPISMTGGLEPGQLFPKSYVDYAPKGRNMPPVNNNFNLGGIQNTSGSVLANPYALSENMDFTGDMVRDYYDPSKFTQFGRRPSNALNQAMNPSLSNSFYTQTIPMPDLSTYAQLR